jgi:hypothetical protein
MAMTPTLINAEAAIAIELARLGILNSQQRAVFTAGVFFGIMIASQEEQKRTAEAIEWSYRPPVEKREDWLDNPSVDMTVDGRRLEPGT